MKLSRRHFLKLSSFTLTGAALAACVPTGGAQPEAGAGSESAAAGEATTITYLIRSDIGLKMQEWTEQAVAEFEEMHPEIAVETIGVPWGDYNAKLLAMYAGGTPPEVSANYAAGFPTFYANDAILPLDDFIQADDTDISVIAQQARNAVTREGQLWALPLAHLPTVVFYNKALFDEAGVDTPPVDWEDMSWTTDEILARAQAIAHDVDNPSEAVWGLIFGTGQLGVFSWLWGIDPFSGASDPAEAEAYRTGIVTEAHFDDPQMVDFIQWVRDLTYEHGVSPRPSDTDALSQTVGWPLMSGRIAMAINGLWAVQNFREVEPSWEWGIGAFPYGPAENNITPLFNDSWMLGANSGNPEAGFEFLKYLGLENGARLYAEITGFFPAHTENYSIWFDSTMEIPNLALSRAELEQVILSAFDHGFVTPGKTLDSYPEWNQVFNQTTAPIWNNEVSVAEGLQNVQQQFETTIASKS